MFKAINNETKEETIFTEAQVRAEIIDTYQHDMGMSFEYGDEEIAKGVNSDDLNDHFDGDTFEGMNYTITRV